MKLKIILFILNFLCISYVYNCFAAESDEIYEVVVYSTPGEPITLFDSNEPAEKIIARKQDKGYILMACINSPVGKVENYLEVTAELSNREWDSIVKFIQDNHLLEWKPDFAGYDVYDFGATGFSITGKVNNSWHWNTEIKNQASISGLFSILAKLAKEKIKSAQLYFIR
jgi:hypothetical protein